MSATSPSWLDRLRCVVMPRISRAQAIELARAECGRRGYWLIDPVHVHWGPFSHRIWTNADRMGGNVSIAIDKCDGHIRSYRVTPK